MVQAVLVTGGAGYIGAHACKALRQAGYLPVSFDNLSLGRSDFVRWGPLIHGDVRDTEAVRAALNRCKPVAVLHFAALSAVEDSVSDPIRYHEHNILGALSLLRAMRDANCRRLILSSTAAVYGAPDCDQIDEDTPTQPINPYGWTKLACERLVADCAAAYGLEALTLRYFNASGADPDGELGEDRPHETHLIARALIAASNQDTDFPIFGDDFNTPNGTAIRDYIHVTDLAEAHVLALKALIGGLKDRVFNLGAGQGASVLQVLDTVRAISGVPLKTTVSPRRPGDPARLVANAQQARDYLGFTPKCSDLDTIVRTAWEWRKSLDQTRLRTPTYDAWQIIAPAPPPLAAETPQWSSSAKAWRKPKPPRANA